MKSLTFTILFFAAISAFGQQKWSGSVGMNYGFTLPTGGMKAYVKNGNGFAMDVLFEAPSRRIATGIDLNFSQYGGSKSKQEYEFSDGTTAPMNVIVSNYYISVMGITRLYFVLDGPVRPFATVKAGYTHFGTSLSIVDPDNTDSCEPVEQDMLMKDGTFAYSAGGGVRIDGAWLFKKLRPNVMFIDLSANVIQGGRVNYMNEDAPAAPATHNNSTRAKEVEARFIDTGTQVIHSHHVGYLYNSFVQLVDLHLGVSLRMPDFR